MAQIQIVCTECGLERAVWGGNEGRGYRVDEELYCCQGCAEDTGCTCDNETHAPYRLSPENAQWGEN